MIQYDKIAEVLEYPDAGYGERIQQVQMYLDRHHPAAGVELKSFTEFVLRSSPAELEELYTRSFEVQAVTTLDIGYVLFGDDYKRGELLVNLNREHRDAGVDCRTELADHLPNVLRLLAKMKNEPLRSELVQKIVAPALRKIISEFHPERIVQKNKIYRKHHKTLLDYPGGERTIYQFPLRAIFRLLEADFHIREIALQGADFLKTVNSEMTIESE